MDPTLIPQLGGTIGLLGVAGFIIFGAFREARDLRRERADEIKDLKKDVEVLKTSEFACRLQVNGLITFVQRAGLDVPDYLIRGNGLDKK